MAIRSGSKVQIVRDLDRGMDSGWIGLVGTIEYWDDDFGLDGDRARVRFDGAAPTTYWYPVELKEVSE